MIVEVDIFEEVNELKGVLVPEFGVNVALDELIGINDECSELEFEPLKGLDALAGLLSLEEFGFLELDVIIDFDDAHHYEELLGLV